MRSWLIYIFMLVVGVLLGTGVCHNYYRHFPTQVDTIYQYKKIPYTPLELKANTMELDVPKVKVPDFVFIDVSSLDTIYKDSVRYIMMPRQYYYTNVNDVEIWHSGIDSTIDSLNVVRKSVKITDKYMPKNVKNHISLGMEVSYYNNVSIPIYFEYERLLHKNIGIYGRVGYDLSSGLWGVGGGARLQICW